MDKLILTVIVNGKPTDVEAEGHAELESVIPRALEQTGNAGQPAANWELRDAAGMILPLDRKIGSFGFISGTRLFLNLRAGVGGRA